MISRPATAPRCGGSFLSFVVPLPPVFAGSHYLSMSAGTETLPRPRAAAWQDSALPRLTPEMLYFLSYGRERPERTVMLQLDVVFPFNGTVYAMELEAWAHFEEMCRADLIGPLSHLLPVPAVVG